MAPETNNAEAIETVIRLLTEIRDTQAATAIVLQSIQAELSAPRLAREHLEIQTRKVHAAAERERQRQQAEAELRDAEERRRLPRLFAGGVGIIGVRSEGSDV